MKVQAAICMVFLVGIAASFNIDGVDVPLKRPKNLCKSPTKFEGTFKLSLTMGGPYENTKAYGTGTAHVDGDKKLAAIYEDVTVRGQHTKVNVYIQDKIMYTVIPSLRSCVKKANSMPFLPGQIPEGADIKVRNGTWKGKAVSVWEIHGKILGQTYNTKIYMTSPECLLEYLDVNTSGVEVTETFTSMKKGVSDPTVFELPSYCKKTSQHSGNRQYGRYKRHAALHYMALASTNFLPWGYNPNN